MFKTILVVFKTLNITDDTLLQQAIVIAKASQARLILAYTNIHADSRQEKFTDPFVWRLKRTEAENALDDLCNELAFVGIESITCWSTPIFWSKSYYAARLIGQV